MFLERGEVVSNALSPAGSKGCCKGGSLTACCLLWRAMEQAAVIIIQPQDPLHSRSGIHGMQPRHGGSISSSNEPTGEVDGDQELLLWVQLHQ